MPAVIGLQANVLLQVKLWQILRTSTLPKNTDETKRYSKSEQGTTTHPHHRNGGPPSKRPPSRLHRAASWQGASYVVVVVVVVVVFTSTHRYNAVRGHKTGSNNSDSVAQLIQRSTSHARIVCSMARTLWRIVARFSALV